MLDARAWFGLPRATGGHVDGAGGAAGGDQPPMQSELAFWLGWKAMVLILAGEIVAFALITNRMSGAGAVPADDDFGGPGGRGGKKKLQVGWSWCEGPDKQGCRPPEPARRRSTAGGGER